MQKRDFSVDFRICAIYNQYNNCRYATEKGGDNMTNAEKLKAKLKEKNMSIEDISETIGIDRSTFYRKLSSDGMQFTIGEVDRISKVLNLSIHDINSIFFSNFIA